MDCAFGVLLAGSKLIARISAFVLSLNGQAGKKAAVASAICILEAFFLLFHHRFPFYKCFCVLESNI